MAVRLASSGLAVVLGLSAFQANAQPSSLDETFAPIDCTNHLRNTLATQGMIADAQDQLWEQNFGFENEISQIQAGIVVLQEQLNLLRNNPPKHKFPGTDIITTMPENSEPMRDYRQELSDFERRIREKRSEILNVEARQRAWREAPETLALEQAIKMWERELASYALHCPPKDKNVGSNDLAVGQPPNVAIASNTQLDEDPNDTADERPITQAGTTDASNRAAKPLPSIPALELGKEIRDIERALGAGGNVQLDDIIIRAHAVTAAIAECKTLECPEFNTCEQARQLEEDLERLIALLEEQLRYLELAGEAHTDHFATLVRNEIQTGSTIADLTMAIAVQDTLIRFSDSLAQIATILGSIDTLADPNSDALSLALDAAKLRFAADQLAQAMDLSKNIASDPNGGFSVNDAAAISGSLGGALDKLRGAESALRQSAARGAAAIRAQGFNVVARSPSAGQVTRGAAMGFTGGPKRGSSILVEVGEVLQGVLSNYAKQRLFERQQRMQNLVSSVVPAEAQARADAFRSLQQVQSRRWKTVDTIALLKKTRAELMECMGRAKCPPRTRTAIDLNLPDFDAGRPSNTAQKGYGKALVHLLGEVEKMRPKIRPVGLREECPATDDTANIIAGNDPFESVTDGTMEFWLPLIAASDGTEYCESREGSPEITNGVFIFPIPTEPTECPGGDESCGPGTVPPFYPESECPGGGSTCEPPTAPPVNEPTECPGGQASCEPTTVAPTPDPGDCPGGDSECNTVFIVPLTEVPECSIGGYDCYIYTFDPTDPEAGTPGEEPDPDPTLFVPNIIYTTGETPVSAKESDCERLEKARNRYEELTEAGPGENGTAFWAEVNSLYLELQLLGKKCPSAEFSIDYVESPSAIGRRHEPQVPMAEVPPTIPNIPVDAFVKGKSRTSDSVARKEEIGGQSVMLTDPSIELFALPGDKVQPFEFAFDTATPDDKPQRGAEKDPMKAITDENGEARISASLDDLMIWQDGKGFEFALGGFDWTKLQVDAPARLEVDLDVTTRDSVNVILQDWSEEDVAKAQDKLDNTPNTEPFESIESFLQIVGDGDLTFTPVAGEFDEFGRPIDPVHVFTIDFDAVYRGDIEVFLTDVFGQNVIIETNKCREKKPLAPRPGTTFVAPPTSAELRGAKVAFDFETKGVSQ